jgi:hypothetical protein
VYYTCSVHDIERGLHRVSEVCMWIVYGTASSLKCAVMCGNVRSI